MENWQFGILFWGAWVGCGFLGAGFTYAHFQRNWSEFPEIADRFRGDDIRMAVLITASGFAGLFASVISRHYRHGWLFPGSRP